MQTQSGFELVELKGGGRSIRSLAHGETMHIGTNPRTEALALHIRQQRLRDRVEAWNATDPFVIWDIGLGPAGNAVTAIEELRGTRTPVEIHSFEISTEVLEFALHHAEALEYLSGWEGVIARLLHEGVAQPLPKIRWLLHRGDFSREAAQDRLVAPAPSAIFFDPYSPARNIEMWNLETFRAIWKAVSTPDAPPCLMTNYTRSTSVRVTMALAGWFVGTGVPTGDKTETTIVANRLELLDRPLDATWISRVRSSTNATPIRGRNEVNGPISPEDFSALKALPQFRA
jgi:queuine tRNA-ribosyltransferase